MTNSDHDPINTKLPSYEVHSARAERTLRELARTLKAQMPSGMGFALFIFDYGDDGDPGNMFYASSAEREGMLKVLHEFIEKLKKERAGNG